MNILTDADALVALAKEDDSNHKKALKISQQISKDTLFISSLTIPEAATVISHQISQQAAILFLEDTRKRKLIKLSLTDELEKTADEIFILQKNKGVSWPDCLNMALAKKYAIDIIFSFDKIYPKNGFKVLS